MKNPMRGCGPFIHDDPSDRPASLFGGNVTLHFGSETPGPSAPPRDTRGLNRMRAELISIPTDTVPLDGLYYEAPRAQGEAGRRLLFTATR